MKFGIALPHIGPTASPEAIVQVARRADALGFDSVWALDRLLWPLAPSSRYPGNPQGKLPASMQNTYDPFTVLTFVAAHTQRVLLGTSVVVAPYRSPLVVAKMAATLDRLSAGRLILGVGAGWSGDEFGAVGQPRADRNELTDEFLRVLYELWSAKEPSFEGKHYRVPRSIFLPKPLQSPRPPVWIGGNSKQAIRRVAELADGWHPTSRIGAAAIAERAKHLRRLAEEAGRDPGRITISLRWNAFPSLKEKGDVEQVMQRLCEFRAAGVEHFCLEMNIPEPTSLTVMLETMERFVQEVVPESRR